MESRYVYRVAEETASEDAVFLVMAAIAMHGMRRAQVQLGEGVAIVGMGVVGQLALSLCALAGAMPVIAVDLVAARLEKAAARTRSSIRANVMTWLHRSGSCTDVGRNSSDCTGSS